MTTAFYDWCVAVAERCKGEDDETVRAAIRLMAEERGQPLETLMPAVRLLPRLTREEVVENPELHAAHWLVLADLIPTDLEFRRFWIHRCKFMGFTAKSMRVELAGAIELQKKLGPDWKSIERRKKHHNE